MASVSSLDRDLSRLRLGKYTTQASQEIKDWITATLNENLGNEDLMLILRDGTILCRYPLPPLLLAGVSKRKLC